MPILLLQSPNLAEPVTSLELTESLRGDVSGFLELSQMLTGRVPVAQLTLDTYLTGEVRS